MDVHALCNKWSESKRILIVVSVCSKFRHTSFGKKTKESFSLIAFLRDLRQDSRSRTVSLNRDRSAYCSTFIAQLRFKTSIQHPGTISSSNNSRREPFSHSFAGTMQMTPPRMNLPRHSGNYA